MVLNSIGLEVKAAKNLAVELNKLLSNFQVYYQNLRGIHWNIKGKRFFDLHVKFEELYTDANIKLVFGDCRDHRVLAAAAKFFEF